MARTCLRRLRATAASASADGTYEAQGSFAYSVVTTTSPARDEKLSTSLTGQPRKRGYAYFSIAKPAFSPLVERARPRRRLRGKRSAFATHALPRTVTRRALYTGGTSALDTQSYRSASTAARLSDIDIPAANSSFLFSWGSRKKNGAAAFFIRPGAACPSYKPARSTRGTWTRRTGRSAARCSSPSTREGTRAA